MRPPVADGRSMSDVLTVDSVELVDVLAELAASQGVETDSQSLEAA
jgi:hypothetical protein